jgi:CRP-like cAMP-binding protein
MDNILLGHFADILKSNDKTDDFFGNSSEDAHVSYTDYATAIENTELYAISREDFHELLQQLYYLT